MISVVMIVRSTLFSVPGGDTVQVTETARHLVMLGVDVEIRHTNDLINYNKYDLLHFFNIIRPADILYHIKKTRKPFVISTILVDYSGYDKIYRKGLAGFLFRFLSADKIEYLKNISRWLLGRDSLMSKSYLWKGQRNSIREILRKAEMVLPNSNLEYERLVKQYSVDPRYMIIPNGINIALFTPDPTIERDPFLVLCVARIEGVKNQLNLIKALNGTKYRLLLIGAPAPNQSAYYIACRKAAGNNVSFIGQLAQTALLKYYNQATTHILPSWFETTGLSSLEAAAMGCNVVISCKGDANEYFGEHAFYCEPSSEESIRSSIDKAAAAPFNMALQQKIKNNYTWQQAAAATLNAYRKITAIS
jgi:glycosyltransferase involved in cell wall biosynthesis